MVATPKLVVIVGETASGKTALAIELAKRFNGEIISADSRTLYKGMDIATAKPTAAEQATVKHYLIDVSTPEKPLTVADFKQLANEAIQDISSRGKLAFLVGGTGLYIDSILYDYQFSDWSDTSLREELNQKPVEELQAMLTERDIPFPENASNKRHLVRRLETNGTVGQRSELRSSTLILGLTVEREELSQRIADRIDAMFAGGVIEEAAKLKQHYPGELDPLKTPGYKALWQMLDGTIDEAEAKQMFAQADRQLAKRQRTWFKRNKSIQWLNNRDRFDQAVELITTLLNK